MLGMIFLLRKLQWGVPDLGPAQHLLTETAEHDALDATDVEEVVLEGAGDGLAQHVGGEVEEETVQPADGGHRTAALGLAQRGEHLEELRALRSQSDLLGKLGECGGVLLSVPRPTAAGMVAGEPGAEAGLGAQPGVVRQEPPPQVDLDPVSAHSNLHPLTDLLFGNRVPILLEVHPPRDIYEPQMDLVDLGEVLR